jgi:hypothetical protein
MPIIISSEPLKPQLITIGNNKINVWKKLIFNENNTIINFKKYYENLFDTIIDIIMFDDDIIYIMNDDEANLYKYINEISDKNKINVSFNSINNIDLPNIIIKL